MNLMIQNLRQRFDASSLPLVAQGNISSTRGVETTAGQRSDFSDREIEMYMLPHPLNPSASLQELYAAIRQRMTLDGCR
jgi:hypothetical protein